MPKTAVVIGGGVIGVSTAYQVVRATLLTVTVMVEMMVIVMVAVTKACSWRGGVWR